MKRDLAWLLVVSGMFVLGWLGGSAERRSLDTPQSLLPGTRVLHTRPADSGHGLVTEQLVITRTVDDRQIASGSSNLPERCITVNGKTYWFEPVTAP